MILTWLMTTIVVGGTASIALTAGAEAATTYTATGNVNIRSGAGTGNAILGVLKKGKTVTSRGAASKGWIPVTYNQKKGWVSTKWVTAKKSSATSTTTPSTSATTAGIKATTGNVNLRAAASLTANIIKVLKKGTTVTTTGKTSGRFSQVSYNGKLSWVSTAYLTTSSATEDTSSATKVVATMLSTTSLTLRAAATNTSASLGSITKSTKVSLTGKHSGSYSQILRSGKLYWVLSGYLTGSGSGPSISLPKATGIRYINATAVNVRAKASTSSTKLASLNAGIALQITGKTSAGYTQVIYSAKTAWVASEYLSTTKASSSTDLGSSSLNKLNETAKASVLRVREEFPEISTIYGWRSSSSYSSDHPSGRAIDIMIPSWSKSSGKALGDEIAAYFIENGKSLDVNYIIWRQQNYRITRGSWVKMSDRGGATANHMDHVHVSFNA